MSKRYRILKRGNEAREPLKKGIKEVYDTVKTTLGPAGRNTVIEQKSPRFPSITNDGWYISREIVLNDEVEDLGGQLVINAAKRTNAEVGDGTTGAIVLTWKIIESASKKLGDDKYKIGTSFNVNKIKDEINEAKDKVIEALNKSKKPIKTLEEVQKVATVAVENEEIGKEIGNMVYKAGVDGFITVEASFKNETSYETIEGMKLPIGYITPALATNMRKEAIIDDVYILVTNKPLELPYELLPVVDRLINNGGIRELAVITPSYSKEVKKMIFVNIMNKIAGGQSNFYTLAIKGAPLTDEQLEDVCVYTGATLMDERKNMKIGGATMGELGKAKRIMVNADETIIIGGKGDKKEIKAYIKKLKEHLDLEKTDMLKNKIRQRIASMSSGVGRIQVGAKSDMERKYQKDKIEDCVYACKAAMEEGIVEGGGLALKKVAEKLPHNILTEALKSPYEQIQKNAGGKLPIGKDIIDPVKVIRVAFENACSVASTFITTENVICREYRDFEENLKEVMEEILRGGDEELTDEFKRK